MHFYVYIKRLEDTIFYDACFRVFFCFLNKAFIHSSVRYRKIF